MKPVPRMAISNTILFKFACEYTVGKYLLNDIANAALKAKQAKLAILNYFYDFSISGICDGYFCLLSIKKFRDCILNRERGPKIALFNLLSIDILCSGVGGACWDCYVI